MMTDLSTTPSQLSPHSPRDERGIRLLHQGGPTMGVAGAFRP
jgi:hypothetical protein